MNLGQLIERLKREDPNREIQKHYLHPAASFKRLNEQPHPTGANMKPKMIDYPLYRDRRPQEIKQLLIDVASGNMPESQKDIVGDMLAESKLMIEAAEYIRQLEILNDLLVPLAQCGRKALNDNLVSGMVEYFKNNHNDLSPGLVNIVEENFWELLA